MQTFSVITPSLNRGRFLDRCIRSVREQRDVQAEHIVVDGESHDNTIDILENFDRDIVWMSEPVRGPAQAVNKGLELARGDVIGWLDPSDIYYPDALKAVVDYFNKHPQVDVVYGHVNRIDEQDRVIQTRRASRWSRRRLRRNCFLTQPAVFFRRDVIERFGKLDERLEYWVAYEYWLRLNDASATFARLPVVLAGSRATKEGNRYLSKNNSRILAASSEVVRLVASKYGRIPTRWILHHARALAQCDGYGRNDSFRYDRQVVAHALRTERVWNKDRPFPAGAARLVSRYVLTELESLLKKRRRRARLPQRKIFILRHHPPRALALPSSYYRSGGPKDLPSISLVTPNYNRGEYIEETIQSVVNQRYPNLQYIIQDGGSTDDSVDIIRRYQDRLDHWESAPDQGQAHAINLGMRHATGDIMAYLNSDDLLLPGALLYVAEYFRRHPQIDVVYGHRVLVDEAGDEIGRWVLPRHDDKVLAWADYIPQETLFWRRRAWDRVGGQIDQSFQFAMDWDLILRFRDAGLRFARAPRFLGAFRVTDAQKTSRLIETLGQREMDRLRFRALGRVPTALEIDRMLKPYYVRHWVFDKLYRLGVASY